MLADDVVRKPDELCTEQEMQALKSALRIAIGRHQDIKRKLEKKLNKFRAAQSGEWYLADGLDF